MKKSSTILKSSLLNGVGAIAIASAFLLGGTLTPTGNALADAVRLEAPQTPSFADVVEVVSPAVVSVRVKAKLQPANQRGVDGFGFDQLPEGHPLRRFFDKNEGGGREFRRGRGNKFGQRQRGRKFTQSQGSGFFVSEDGYIVTNNHVVSNGSAFTVVLNNGDEYDAALVGADPKTDLAVLKVESKEKFTHVAFSEKKSRVGEWVVAVGNPFGLGGTVTAGIVSASGRDIGSGPYDDFIQIDAAVNKGNSGGPAFNLNGEVIGVNTAIFSPSGGNVGIAFAISAGTAEQVVGDLIKNGQVSRGWLGVQIQPVTKDIASSIGLDKARGAIVAEPQRDSPAEKAGIKSGDVILSVDGKKIRGPKALARAIANASPKSVVALEVFRNGSTLPIEVELGTLPGSFKKAKVESTNENSFAAVEIDQLGFSVRSSANGVFIDQVDPNGPASEKGIQPGDLIVSINGRNANTINQVGAAVASAIESERKAILFQLKSGPRNRFVAVPVAKG